MVNKKKKGQKKELLVQKVLEKFGAKILFKSVTVKQGPIFRGYDFAHLFDIVAVHKTEWFFISVKHSSSNGGNKHLDELKQFAVDHISKFFGREAGIYRWTWFKPGWRGRGKNKTFDNGFFKVEIVRRSESGSMGMITQKIKPTQILKSKKDLTGKNILDTVV